MTKTETPLVDEVAEILEEERAALLDGDLDKIQELLPRKIELAERLEGADGAALTGLSELQSTALRNQELLDQALLGIKSVADRLTEMRKVKAQLDTYDASGRKHTILTPQTSVERRA